MNDILYNALKQNIIKDNINPFTAQLLEDILDSSYDAIAILNSEPRFLYVNKNYEKILDFKKEEVLNIHINDLVKTKKIIIAPSLEVIKTKQTSSSFQKMSNGTEALITASPVFNSDGEIILIVDNIRDITDLHRLKEKSLRYKLKNTKLEKELLEYKLNSRENSEIVYKSKSMNDILEIALRASYTCASVLITGESGVGKGLIAKFIHLNSDRKLQPFVSINCSAIPESLFESELFGYEEGAFTGAKKQGKPGLFEIASNGTLFLDEITEMPINIQSKLLTVLQDKSFYRVGSVEQIFTNARIIAATNSNIQQKIKDNKFRKDLFYRLNVIPINIPPLKERKEDILPLTIHFLNINNKIYKKNKKINFEAEKILISQNWPGNIRELQNTVERLIILDNSDDGVINSESVIKAIDNYDLLTNKLNDQNNLFSENTSQLKDIYKNIEYKLLISAATEYKTSRKIAEALGISHPTVLKKMKMYNIDFKKNKN